MGLVVKTHLRVWLRQMCVLVTWLQEVLKGLIELNSHLSEGNGLI